MKQMNKEIQVSGEQSDMEIKFEVHWLLGENIMWLWDRMQGQRGLTFFFSQ